MKKFILFAIFLIFVSSIAIAGDTTPPTITKFDFPSTVYVNQIFTVNATATDNVAMSYLRLITTGFDGNISCSSNTCSATWSLSFPNNGSYSLRLAAADTSLNKRYQTKYITVKPVPPPPDTTPPTVSVSGAPASWQNTNAQASVSCSDAGSGCSSTSYRLKTYTSASSCSNNYADYTLTSPQTISSHLWVCAAAKDNAGNTGFSNQVEFMIDKVDPILTNQNVYPTSPTTYSPTQIYTFNITATDSDSGINTVVLTFNGNHYSASLSGGSYVATINSLNSGTYNYFWTATDNAGNSVQTSQSSYQINKAQSTASMTVNPSANIAYGTPLTVACTSNNPETNVVLRRNGNDVSSENGFPVILAAGGYDYICSIPTTTNYLGFTTPDTIVTITKATPSLSLTLNGNPSDLIVTYGTQTTATGTVLFGDSASLAVLKRDGSQVANGSPATETTILDAKLTPYSYSYEYPGSQNFTSTSITRLLTVNQAQTVIRLFIDGYEGDRTFNAPASYVVTGNKTVVGNLVLLKNGVPVASTSTQNTLTFQENNVPAGSYVYRLELTSNNYFANPVSRTVTVINPDTTPPSITNCQVSPANPIYVKNAQYTFSCDITDNVGLSDVWFTFNSNTYYYSSGGVSRNGNTFSKILVDLPANPAGYQYSWFANDTSNNVASYYGSYVINKASPITHLYLNGNEADLSIPISTQSNATGWIELGEQPGSLYRNGNLIGTGIVVSDVRTLPAGIYTYRFDYPSSQNYSFGSVSRNLSVVADTTPPVCSNFITNPTSPSNYVPGASYTFQATCTDNVAVSNVLLEFNGVNYTATMSGNIYSVTLRDLAVASYPNRWIAIDTSNLQSSFPQPNYIVNQALTTLRLFLNGTESDRNYNVGDYANFTAELTNLPGKQVSITSNLTGIDKTGLSPLEDIVRLNTRGIFYITGAFAGNQNYSASSRTYMITVNAQDTTSPVCSNQIENPQSPTVFSLTTTYKFNITCTDDTAVASVTLNFGGVAYTATKDGNVYYVTFAPSSSFAALGVGNYTYNWIAIDTSGNQFTGSLASYLITPASATLSLAINGLESDQTFVEPATYNVSTANPYDGIINLYKNGQLINQVPAFSSFAFDESNIQAGTYNYTVELISSNFTSSPLTRIVTVTPTCQSHLVDSYVDSVYYLDSRGNIFAASTITCSLINKTNVTISKIDLSNITLSQIRNSTISNSDVYNCTISDSNLVNQSCKDSSIDPSDVQRSNTTGSSISDSHVWDSNATYSSITLSTLDFCDITNSTLYNVTCRNSSVFLSNISNSTIVNSIITNSTINNSDVHDLIVTNATIQDNVLTDGCIIYQGVKYCATKNLYDIYNPPSSTPTPPPGGGGSQFFGYSHTLGIDPPSYLQVNLGINKSFVIYVTNQGPSYMSSVSLDIQGIPKEWFTITPQSQFMDSKQTRTFSVNFHIPLSEIPGNRTITFLATNNGVEVNRTALLDIQETLTPIPSVPGIIGGALFAVSNFAFAAGIIIIIIAAVLIYIYYFQRERWDALISYLKTVYTRIKDRIDRLLGRWVIEIEEYTKPGVKQAEIEAAEHPDAEAVAKFTVEYEE